MKFLTATYQKYLSEKMTANKRSGDKSASFCLDLKQKYNAYPLGTEELAHLEIVGTIVRQLAKNATTDEIENSPFGAYFMNHGRGVYPANATGEAFSAMALAVTADPIADLTEDLAAEQKARAVYDNILRVSDDPDVNDVIKFLRQREIVHFQRFGEALDQLQNRPMPKMYCGK